MDSENLLVVVDMQNDFVNGPLGTPEAEQIVDRICKKIDDWDGHVVFTKDTHYEDYLETVEGKHIPVKHCIDNSGGWQLVEKIERRRAERSGQFGRTSFVVYKDSFGAPLLCDVIRDLEVKTIQLVGVCTDICVLANALLVRSLLPEVRVFVDPACCAGTSPRAHMAALEIMRKCCIDIIEPEG